jgi:MoxR-like ATPase
MGKKVFDFKSFVINEYNTNEGYISDKFSLLASWAKDLVQGIKDGLVKMIPSGSKKGIPVASYFDPSAGSIVSQINALYSGTPFAKENPVEIYESSITESDIEEAKVPLAYTGEDQTVRNVDAQELKEMIEKLYRSKVRGGRAKPIFVFGAPGIGKTQIVGQAADSLGVPMINLDLQFMAPEDFLGIPKVVDIQDPEIAKFKETGEKGFLGQGATRSNPPSLLPRSNGIEGKGGILFMDEMNRANKTVLNSVMQFVQMGRLGEYILPDKWILVAAGNRPSEADVAEFDFALADRFTIVNLEPKVEDWVEWAKKSNKFEPEFVNFVSQNQELFHYLDDEKGTLKFPTPRSWTDAAAILRDEMEDREVKSWRQLPLDVISNIYADQLGPDATGKLVAYLGVLKKFTDEDLAEMVKDPKKAKTIAKSGDFTSVMYGLYEMVLRKAEELSQDGKVSLKDLNSIMQYFNKYEELEVLSWIYKRITDEFPEFAVTDEVLRNKDTDDSKLKIEAAKMIQSGARTKSLI